jgi:hypothetical protein
MEAFKDRLGNLPYKSLGRSTNTSQSLSGTIRRSAPAIEALMTSFIQAVGRTRHRCHELRVRDRQAYRASSRALADAIADPTILYELRMQRSRWEYMMLDVGVSGFWLGPNLDGDALTAKLNELGMDGWEVVVMSGMNLGYGRTKDLVMVLKRPRG